MIVTQRGSTEGGRCNEIRYGDPAELKRMSRMRDKGTDA